MKKSEIQTEISEYEALLKEPSVPQDEKDFAKTEIADLKKKLADLEKAETTKAKKAPSKKAEPAKKAAPKAADYDCDEMIKEAKARKAAQKKSAAKAENTPVAKKDEKRVEKVVESIKKHYKAGDLTKTAIEKLIKEFTEKLSELKELLKSAK